MCGRYVIASDPETLRRFFGYEDRPNFPPRFNIAPTQPVPIVRMEGGVRRFALVRWGLIPRWVKDPAQFSQLHNARADSVLDKPAFKAAMTYRRCLLIADGFYDWRTDAQGRKTPHYVRMASGEPMAMAGLWECWIGPNGEELETTCVITVAANAMLASIHHRMPALIAPQDFDAWLDCRATPAATAAKLLVPAADDAVVVHPVAPDVNNAANDSVSLIRPVAATSDDGREPVTTARVPSPRRPTLSRQPDDRQPSLF